MKKYFAVDVSNDIHIVELHETLNDAKQSCLQHANEAYNFAGEMDDFEEYLEYDLPYAIYGVVLGRVTSTTRQLTEEEAESGDYGDDEITNPPEIVELNGWISVDERLPPISDDKWFYSSGSLLCYGKEEPTDNNHIFIGYSTDGNGFYSDNGSCYQVFFWQPLPQPPETE